MKFYLEVIVRDTKFYLYINPCEIEKYLIKAYNDGLFASAICEQQNIIDNGEDVRVVKDYSSLVVETLNY